MSSPLGQYGSKGYESSESRTLGKFQSDKFTYREQAKNIIELNNAVGYMSGMMRKMQRGIDEANQNFLQQIQGLINDIIVIIGGGGDTGFEFGDLKYVLMAIGALFGFGTEEGGIGLPINLFEAAWHFISSYILPVQNFTDAINMIVDSLIAGALDIFGEVPIVGQALQQLAVIISDIRDLLMPVADAIETFFEIFDLGTLDLDGIKNVFEPLKPIWEALSDALDGINLPDFSAILHEIAGWAMPFVQLIPQVVNALEPLINTLIDTGGGILELAVNLLIPIIEIIAPIIDLIAPVINALFPIIDAIIAVVDVVLSMVGSVANITNLFDYILTAFSPLNALNLFNNIPENLIGNLSFDHIGQGNPNLLANPGFEGAISVHGGSMWQWDAVAGHTSPGSVYTTANGTLKQLRSNPIAVSKDQKLDVSVWTMWSGLAYTGTAPIKIQFVRLFNDAEVAIDDLFPAATPGANQATWVEAATTYVVPTGCDKIALQLVVNSNATAGTIRFDDGDVHKTGSLGQFIPPLNMFGIGGPADMGSTVQTTWDQLIGGLVDQSGFGAALSDMFSIPRDVSSWASLGRMSFGILGIRDNKSLNTGFLPTSESTIPLDSVALQSTLPTFAITPTTAIMGYKRISEAVDKGVVSWQGYGAAGVTGCYINLYKMNTDTGVNTLVHASTNQSGLLSGTSVPVPVVYSLPSLIHMEPGEVWGVEIVVRGANHNILGVPSGLQDQVIFPKRYSSVRDSSSVIAPATFTPTYGTNVPFIEIGITAAASTPKFDPLPTQVNAVGTTPVAVPSWVNFVDVIAVGGGGHGGGGSLYGVPGQEGGEAGHWATGTWTRGTHFTGAVSISVTVPSGGPAAYLDADAGYALVRPVAGSSIASVSGNTITATGGAAASSGNQKGQAAGNQIYRGITYVGGGPQNSQPGDGAIPGGGGGSGNDYSGTEGGEGAKGRVWLVFRQT